MNTRCCSVQFRSEEEVCCEVEEDSYDYCDCELCCVCVDETTCCAQIVSDCDDQCPRSIVQTVCVEKPKKSFWQQLFSPDKKCCPSLKKKSTCKCKRVKKLVCKCGPDCQNIICQELRSKNKSGPCKCNSKANTCAQKPCMPSRKSICGCHFYLNLENRPHKSSNCKKTKPSQEERKSCVDNRTSETYRYNIHEEPVRDSESGVVRRSLLRNRLSDSCSSPKQSNQESSQPLSAKNKSICSKACRQPKESKEKKPCDKKVGLTITKEEIKYYKPDVQLCQSKKDDSECEISNSSSEKLNENNNKITVEINNSGVALIKTDQCDEVGKGVSLKDKNCTKENGTANQKPTCSPNVQRVSRLDRYSQSPCNSRKSRLSGHNILDLDKRVSEILRKLDCIEQKINILEKNNADTKAIRIDFDKQQKSTISLHLNDKQRDKKYDCNSNRDKSKCGNCQRTTRIELKRSKSSSCAIARPSKCNKNKPKVSKSLDRCSNNGSSSHRIIISLSPNKYRNASRQLFVTPGKRDERENSQNRNNVAISWCDVSKDLQTRSHKKSICYCIECCQKRVKCL